LRNSRKCFKCKSKGKILQQKHPEKNSQGQGKPILSGGTELRKEGLENITRSKVVHSAKCQKKEKGEEGQECLWDVAITKSFSINRLDRTHCQNFT
jgi:hypothetical protein